MMAHSLPRQVAVCLLFSGNEILFADQGATPVCNLRNQNRKKNSYPGTDGKYLLVLCHRDLECLWTNTAVALQPHTASSLPLLCAFAHSEGFFAVWLKGLVWCRNRSANNMCLCSIREVPKKVHPSLTFLYFIHLLCPLFKGCRKARSSLWFHKGCDASPRLVGASPNRCCLCLSEAALLLSPSVRGWTIKQYEGCKQGAKCVVFWRSIAIGCV